MINVKLTQLDFRVKSNEDVDKQQQHKIDKSKSPILSFILIFPTFSV